MENTLQKYLQQVENQLNEISKGIPLPEVFKNELDTISNLNKQDKIDDVQYVVKTLKDLFQSIANKWRPPLTVKFQENYIQSMIQLNQAISSLRSEEIPIPELKKESTEGLQKYTDAVYNTIQDKITFFTNIKIAEDIVPKRDTEHIVHTITSISNFINSQSKNFKDYREDIAQSLLLVLTISNKMKYEEHAKLESNSIQLVSLQTSEFDIPILCFDISYHLHEMLTQLNPRSAKSKESIEKLLLESYLDPKKMNILETEYYTLVYSKMQKIKSIVFDNVRNSIRGCFHGQGTIVTINYDSAIDVLKSSLPEQISIREVAKELPKEFSRSSLSIYDTQEQPNIDKNINQHLYYCENTGLWYLTKNGYQIKIEEPETIDYHFKKLEVINEINLPKIDQGKAQNYIHVPLVGEMMRNISDSSIEPDLKFNEVGYLFNSRYERSNLNLYTEKKIEKDYKYLTLKINDFSFENGPLENTIGMLYVLDSTKKMPITEPIFFIIKDGKPIFNDSNITKVIFTLNDSKTLILVCRLFHDQAYDLTSFLSSLSNGKKILKNTSSPYNFAACGISLYDNKGNFNNVTSFPQHFYVIQPGTALIVDTALLTVLSQPPSFKLLIKSSIELKLEDKIIDNNYCYTWNYLGNSQTLISSNTELTSTTLTPIIELNNIQFTFKKAQTGKYVYFKAYLVENDSNIKDPQGLPNILTYTSNKLSNVYVSSVVPFTTRCQFPDFVRFHINKKLKKSTHIIIQFFSVTPGQSPELYKLSIIPFYDNKTPIRSSQMEVTLFQLNQSPMTNYLAKAKKLNAKSKTIFNIIVPPIYFPHQNLRKLLSSKISLNLKEIVTNDIPKNLIDESFLYTFSRLLMITSNTNVQALVVYLSKFSYDEVNPLINTWLYNYFNPLLSENFASRLFIGYSLTLSNLFKAELNYDTVLLLLQYLMTLPIFINIILVTLMIYKHKNVELTEDVQQDLISTIKCISKLIITLASIELTTNVNQLFSQFMFYIYPLLPNNQGLILIQEHFEALGKIESFNLEPLFPTQTDTKSKHSVVPVAPFPKPAVTLFSLPIRSLRLKLDFIEIFARNINFLASCAYADNVISIFNIIISSLMECSKIEPKLIKKWIIIMSEFIRTAEHFPNICQNCATILIPYFRFAISIIDKDFIVNDYITFQHLLVTILFITHASNKDNIIKFFNSNETQQQANLIIFFEKLFKICITPTEDIDGKATKFRNSVSISQVNQLNKLKENAKNINFSLYNELSVRIIEFLNILIEKTHFGIEVSKAMTNLITLLLGPYQSWDNYKHILLIIVKLVDMQSNKFFFHMTEPYEQLIEIAVKLVERHMRIARASGVALLIHYLYVDYLTTENMVITKYYLLDKYSNMLFEVSHNLMPLYKILIDRLRLFITSFCISSDFARLCEERLDAAKIIYDSMCVIRGTNKSPELKVQMMLRIADQFYGYPTIRLKWLQKIVEVNVCEKLMAQASIAELQVTFLLDFMMRLHSNEHHIQPLDFSFCNNSKTETLIDINHCPETMRSELTKHQLFCAEGIINSINKAIQYATEAKLNWAIKIYYLLLIQIHESQRNYLELSDLVHKLSDNYYVINELFEKPLQPQLYFYLLERRRNNECIQIEVFSSTISDLNDYASYLNNKETKRFEYLGPAFTASNHEEASTTTNGICVSILKPLNNPLFSFDNNTFYQDIIYHNDDYVNGIKMKRIIFTTDKALPNSSICANVINIATQNYGHFETFKLVVQNSMDELKKCSDAILSMIPTNENIDRYTKNKPLFPLQPCRCTIRYELKKKSPALSAILEKFRNIDENPESVSPSEKEIAVNWIQQIMNTIQALKKGIDEVQGQERLSQEYMKLRDKASKYSYILFNEDLKFVEPKKKVDPMEYVSPYEDATSF